MVPVTPKPYFNPAFLRPHQSVSFNLSISSRFVFFLKNNLSQFSTWPVGVLGRLWRTIVQLRTLRRRVVISGFNYKSYDSIMKEV